MGELVSVARASEIPDGGAIAVDIDGVRVALVNCGGRLFAISDVCTHAEALLHEGSVDRVRCTIECPLHGAEFDLATGAVLTPPAVEPVQVFPVRVQGDEVRIAVRPRGPGQRDPDVA